MNKPAKTKAVQPTIAQKLQAYLDVPNRQISGGGSNFDTNELKAWVEVLNGTDKDFIIFENAGGRPFMIWMDGVTSDLFKTAGFAKSMKNRGYVFMYQVNKKQTIIRELPNY